MSKSIFERLTTPNKFVKEQEDSFSVVSYNILAECHRKRGDYSFTAEEYLCQDYRHQLLLQELVYLDGDILILQEVNPDYYRHVLMPALSSLGYAGHFFKRCGERNDEGEATLYKRNRFELESCKTTVLFTAMEKDLDELELELEVYNAIKQYIDMPDIILFCQLRCKKTNLLLTIGNVHIVWDELKCKDVQCLQKALVDHIGPLYRKNQTKFLSAYDVCQGFEPQITSDDGCYRDCLDYQFYKGDLDVVEVMDVLDVDYIKGLGGLPAKDIPSDHLSLKATYYFK